MQAQLLQAEERLAAAQRIASAEGTMRELEKEDKLKEGKGKGSTNRRKSHTPSSSASSITDSIKSEPQEDQCANKTMARSIRRRTQLEDGEDRLMSPQTAEEGTTTPH